MWQVETIVCNGSTCSRTEHFFDDQLDAINAVLVALPWEGERHLGHVWENGKECYEDQATATLMHGGPLEIQHPDGATYAYAIRRIDAD